MLLVLGRTMAPKAVLFTDLKGLCHAWGADQNLRTRMRTHKRLLLEKPPAGQEPEPSTNSVSKTAENVRYNVLALRPLVKRMSSARSATACIETLTAEVLAFHESHGFNPGIKVVSDEAWGLRYLMGCLKNVMWKKNPPRETWPHIVV